MENNKVVARFEKISKEQFTKECPEGNYDLVSIPARGTKGSNGYDIVSPISFWLKPGEGIKIPTGIRVVMFRDDIAFVGMPRSGLGFKYRLQLDNTLGLIDSDYHKSENHGHIFIKVTNDSKKGDIVTVNAGDRFAQGIFIETFYAENDSFINEERTGGMGSTGLN